MQSARTGQCFASFRAGSGRGTATEAAAGGGDGKRAGAGGGEGEDAGDGGGGGDEEAGGGGGAAVVVTRKPDGGLGARGGGGGEGAAGGGGDAVVVVVGEAGAGVDVGGGGEGGVGDGGAGEGGGDVVGGGGGLSSIAVGVGGGGGLATTAACVGSAPDPQPISFTHSACAGQHPLRRVCTPRHCSAATAQEGKGPGSQSLSRTREPMRANSAGQKGLTGGGGAGAAAAGAAGDGGGSGDGTGTVTGTGDGDGGSKSVGRVRPHRDASPGTALPADAAALAPAAAGRRVSGGGEGAGGPAPNMAAAAACDGAPPAAAAALLLLPVVAGTSVVVAVVAGRPLPAADRNWTEVCTSPAGAPATIAWLRQAGAKTGSKCSSAVLVNDLLDTSEQGHHSLVRASGLADIVLTRRRTMLGCIMADLAMMMWPAASVSARSSGGAGSCEASHTAPYVFRMAWNVGSCARAARLTQVLSAEQC